VTFAGAFRHDPTDPSETMARTIKLYAVDGAGNKSEEYTITLNTRNEPAKYAGGMLAEGGFAASFTKPVLLIMPNENVIKPVYSHTKTHMPYFVNGVYEVEYTDIFGDIYRENIDVDQFDSLYNCTVSISETAPTNKNVQVLINTGFNTAITLELPESIPGAVIEPSYDSLGAVVGAAINMSQNGSISFNLKPKDSAYPAQTRTVVISNIDKTPPVVSLEWVYTADVEDGKTGGEIIVSLTANEELKALETGRTHMFTLYDQAPYTFIYEDLAGNGGSITAVPPAVIVEKTRVELDDVPPDYDFAIYKGENGTSIKVGGYNKEQYEALSDKAEAFPLFYEVLQIKFNIYDENQTMITLEDHPETGVSLIGNTVTVSDNAQFKVVITDANNNRTEVLINITKADRIPPTGTVTYVEKEENVVRAYLELYDNAPGEITLKNTYGVLIETEPGEYQGKYYHEFLDNESFTFLFADAAGNMGSVTAAVTSIDTGMPVGTISEWIPYFIDSNGNAYKGVLSDRVTNSDVSVYIRFNKPVKSVNPTIVDSIGDIRDISVSYTGDSATVVFRQNAKVKLTYTALNNRFGSTILEVDIIDKKAPDVTAVKTSSGSGPAVYTFTADEDVYFEGEDVSTPGRIFTKTFELNGEYDLIFTDKAGNSTNVHVKVTGIDRTPPSISVTGLPATREAIEAYNRANGTSIQPTPTTQPVSIKAFTDEKGTITFRGVKYSVEAGEQVTLTIDSNGTYEIIAADESGMTTRYSFRIDCIDRTKPQILLPGGTLFVRQGTSEAEFIETALANVFVSDNYDTSPAVTVSRSLDAGQLNTPGIYSIEFTATDSAGNVRTASCFVQVYDKDLLEVLVNGKPSQPEGTLFVGVDSSRQVNVQVNNMPEGPGGTEPYKMYWKQGLNTPGQMKDAKEFSGSFTALQDDFYTIYIVTQSRGSYITHIYVQQ